MTKYGIGSIGTGGRSDDMKIVALADPSTHDRGVLLPMAADLSRTQGRRAHIDWHADASARSNGDSFRRQT